MKRIDVESSGVIPVFGDQCCFPFKVWPCPGQMKAPFHMNRYNQFADSLNFCDCSHELLGFVHLNFLHFVHANLGTEVLVFCRFLGLSVHVNSVHPELPV